MIFEKFRVDGQVALVTGGTRGIGLGIAHALGEAGARLIISSRVARPEALKELTDRGFSVDYIGADMLDPKAPAALIAAALLLEGRLDILVNNAGIAQHGDTETFPAETYRRLMTVNLDSVFLACQAALGPMRRQRSGVILNIGSISGLISNIPQRQAAYNASKAAVHMLTKSLASDYAMLIQWDLHVGGMGRGLPLAQRLDTGRKRAVMVSFHGGGFAAGSGNAPGYDGPIDQNCGDSDSRLQFNRGFTYKRGRRRGKHFLR